MISKLGVLIIGLAIFTTGGYLTYERYFHTCDSHLASACTSHHVASESCATESTASCCASTSRAACCSEMNEEATEVEVVDIMPRVME